MSRCGGDGREPVSRLRLQFTSANSRGARSDWPITIDDVPAPLGIVDPDAYRGIYVGALDASTVQIMQFGTETIGTVAVTPARAWPKRRQGYAQASH